MANLPVKWFDHKMHGLPPLSGTPGAMIAIMDAIFVDGFGATNIISINVKNKKATVVLQDGVKFFKYGVIVLSGFSNQVMNTEFKVIDSDIGKLVFDLDLPDGVVESTNGVVKYAPLGWIKPFSGVSKAIYKPNRIDALNWMFSVDDTQAQVSMVCLCEGATSVDSLIDQRPSHTKLRWGKSPYANTNPNNSFWFIGDPYCFYYKTPSLSGAHFDKNLGNVNFVGEGVRLSNVTDPFAVYITGQSNFASLNCYCGDIFYSDGSNPMFTLRSFNGLKSNQTFQSSVRSSGFWSIFNEGTYWTADNQLLLFTDNYLYSSDRRITKMPGFVSGSGFKPGYSFETFVDAKDNALGRDLIQSRSPTSYYSYDNANRWFYFDITGPWR